MRVLEPGGQLCLPAKPLLVHTRSHFRRQHLDDDLSSETGLVGQEHVRHSAAAELLHNVVRIAEGGAPWSTKAEVRHAFRIRPWQKWRHGPDVKPKDRHEYLGHARSAEPRVQREHAARKLQFQLPTTPVPRSWLALLAQHVPLARGLSADDQERLLRVARLLLDEVPFEGCQGLEITEDIRVTIAATAALLVRTKLPLPRFTKLVRVLVYPETFLPVRSLALRHYAVVDTVEEPVATLGEAWMSGVGRSFLARACGATRRALRETATSCFTRWRTFLTPKMAFSMGSLVLDDPSLGKAWAAILQREFAVQLAAVARREGTRRWTTMQPQTTRSSFAVATESFFCTPSHLRDRLPDLYLQLSRFFRQDPVGVSRVASS